MQLTKYLGLGLALSVAAGPAAAYVGPGAGLSAIGSALAFLGVIGLMIVGLVWYPVKRLLGKSRPGAEPQEAGDETGA